MKKALAHRYYRLGLAAAKQRRLSLALRYAQCAFALDPENNNVSILAEICRRELGVEHIPEQAAALVKQKSWSKAARLLSKLPHQSVHILAIQGCLWALAKRRVLSADCFVRLLVKDGGNFLATEALAELRSGHKFFWRFF